MSAGVGKNGAWRFGLLHAALVAGSILFSIPFLWLMSTSAKVPDEMYPPRWIPEGPNRVAASPYLGMRTNEAPTRPTKVRAEDWKRLHAPILNAISTQLEAMAGQLPDFYQPYLSHPLLAEGVFSRLLKRAPDELFEKVEDVAAGWFTSCINVSLVEDVFENVYRYLALSEVTFQGWDVSVENPTAEQDADWTLTRGEAALVPRHEGLARPALEVQYSFARQNAFSLQTVLPLRMDPKNLKRIIVSNRADRTWHELWVTVELDGLRYQSDQPAFLGTDRWQDTVWQVASEDDDSIKMKTWLRMSPRGESDFREPGRIRITLEYRKAAAPLAVFNKYYNNYRDVLRMVPFGAYVANSLVLVVLNVIGQILGSSLVAYAFARLRWPGRDQFFLLLLATLMIPPQVTMIPVFLIFKWLGWYNTLMPLWVGSVFGSAFYIFLLRQFMKSIPKDLEDSAKIDGCTYLGIYTRIILPLVKPALATIGIFTFMAVWNDFMGPLIYLNDQRLYPLSLGLFALNVFTSANYNYGFMMAASVLMTLPVIALFFVAQRQFIQGVTLTGMKG